MQIGLLTSASLYFPLLPIPKDSGHIGDRQIPRGFRLRYTVAGQWRICTAFPTTYLRDAWYEVVSEAEVL